MKSIVLISAAAAVMIAQGATAQGIALFGDARLGLGYNIDNDGGILTETDEAGMATRPTTSARSAASASAST